jgi:hypothetical protein
MLNSVADVAAFAESMGKDYHYNGVLALMEKDHILPFYERKTLEVYKGVGKGYGWSEALCEIFDAYVEKHGSQELTD